MNIPDAHRIVSVVFAAAMVIMALWFGAILEKATFEGDGVCEYVDANGGTVAFCSEHRRPDGDGWQFVGFAKQNPLYRVYVRGTDGSALENSKGWTPPSERDA